MFGLGSVMQDTPVVMAVQATIRESERSVAIAFADLTKRQLGMTEFLDDDQYTCLESAMVALGCRECVIPQENVKSPDARKLRDVMARCNVLVTEKKKTNFRFVSSLCKCKSMDMMYFQVWTKSPGAQIEFELADENLKDMFLLFQVSRCGGRSGSPCEGSNEAPQRFSGQFRGGSCCSSCPACLH
jgi:DNA mismatch repair ATPase MutS